MAGVQFIYSERRRLGPSNLTPAGALWVWPAVAAGEGLREVRAEGEFNFPLRVFRWDFSPG